MTFPSLLLCVALTGCSSTETIVEPLAVFASIDTATELPSTELVEIPAKPEIGSIESNGSALLVLTPDEGVKLVAYVAALKANTAIAREQGAIIKAQQDERRALIEAGRGIEREANFLARRLAETQDELKDEKAIHAIDNLLHRVLFLAAVLVGL